MNITKQLKIKTMGIMPTEPNGVLLSDGGIEYPVLNEALTNTIIFPQLISSGYKLVALPYTFELDGQAIKTLPAEEYIPADQNEERKLFDMVGAKYNNGDLTQWLSEPMASIIQMPPTHYTINTRQEFLSYLEDISTIEDITDYKPINYFVAPSALFSYTEYFSDENKYYRDIIENRRIMRYDKFLKLFEFLKQYGISEESTPFDVVAAYFAWGIDGIRFTAASKRVEVSEVPVSSIFRHMALYAERHCTGLMDNKKSKILPREHRDKTWMVSPVSQTDVQVYCEPDQMGRTRLKDGETIIVDFTRRVSCKHMEYSCGTYYIEFDQKNIIFNSKDFIMDTLTVMSNIQGEYVDLEMAIPSSKSLVNYAKEQYITAIAQYILAKRKVNTDASTYNLLTMFGLTPSAALKWIAAKLETTEGFKHEFGDDDITITNDEIDVFCDNHMLADINSTDTDNEVYNIEDAETKYAVLMDIVNGATNVGQIGIGQRDDAQINVNAITRELRILHYILEVPLNTIYQRVKQAQLGDTLEFSGNNITRSIALTPVRRKVDSYANESLEYTFKASKEAYNIIEIQRIARELGDNSCTRHVAAEFLRIQRNSQIKVVIDSIKDKLTEGYNIHVTDPVLRTKCLNVLDYSAVKELFYIYHTKHFKYYGTNVQEIAPDWMVTTILQNVERFFDTIQGMTKYSMLTTKTTTVGLESVDVEYTFGQICINAFITPTEIIPRKGFTIKEVSFNALWKDYRSNPNIRNKLIELGIIDDDFIAFSLYSCNFLKYGIDVYDDPDSPQYYEKQAKQAIAEAKENKHEIIHAVPHPVEYLYPGIYKPAEPEEAIGETNGIDIHVGYMRELTFVEKYPATASDPDNKAVGVKPFSGFDAETFYLGVNTFVTIPVITDVQHQLVNSDDKFITVDTNTVYDFTRIEELKDAGYPVTHVRNNIYLVKLLTGEIMEVVI